MMGVKADYFVPHRVHHGYGLSCAVVDLLAARTPRPDVLLTVDNGVSSAEAGLMERLFRRKSSVEPAAWCPDRYEGAVQ